MKLNDDKFIENLKLIARTDSFPSSRWYTQHVNPPVTPVDIMLAEELLGLSLPPFLKRIYLEVGNGGFGPDFGLAKLFTSEQDDPYSGEGFSIVHTTLLFRKWGDWPDQLIVLGSQGCTIYTSILCSEAPYPIVRSDQTYHVGIEASSLQDWLQDWLDGKEKHEQVLLPVSFEEEA